MKSIGIFEAKTKLSEICEEVSATGRPVLITRRGKPMVTIATVQSRESVWEARASYVAEKPPMKADYRIPARSKDGPDFKVGD